jgi:hypothetical protein
MTFTRIGGWWRLWIVAATVYGAVVLAITWQSFPRIEEIPYHVSQLKSLSDRSLEILAGHTQPSVAKNDPKWKSAPIVLEMANRATFEVPGNTPDEQSQEIAKDYVRVLNSIVQEKRLAAIQTAVIWWLIPCIFVLALGWAIGWTYRGFKQ